ncbi:MAG: polyphosphate polymerase domain-containing protein [Clostridia bacterium]|jgi:SPX domain protein involved in polyphosphate accumulation|nr:polyphosphate polymerase domain-containing protein [Clostridia bacterium]MBO7359934.1 polyphosphate polymerase domain-containing protein [Clostridia bacterium]
MAITVMQRTEMKYLLSAEQTDFLRDRLKGHMEVDKYGKSSIASLYYDTPSYQLIRTSVEKPEFKEKIRLRSYGLATEESPVFLELKRKAYEIVYKRRVQTTLPLVRKFFSGEGDICAPGQINREITAFRDYYKTLVPACMIICDRTAYFEPGGDLRLTVDEDPRYRLDDLTLTESMSGISLLEAGRTILEIKVQAAMPVWLAKILSEGGIRQGSFSKYGEAYRQQLIRAQII